MNIEEMWNRLLEYTTEEVLQVVTDINGYSEDTLLDILYCVTGYRSFEQLEEA